MLLPEKYESIFDVSSRAFVEGPLHETSKILSYFSGRSPPHITTRILLDLLGICTQKAKSLSMLYRILTYQRR